MRYKYVYAYGYGMIKEERKFCIMKNNTGGCRKVAHLPIYRNLGLFIWRGRYFIGELC